MNYDVITPLLLLTIVTVTFWISFRIVDRHVWRTHLPEHKQEKILHRKLAKHTPDVIIRADQFTLTTDRITDIAHRHGRHHALQGEVTYRQVGKIVTRTPTHLYRTHPTP